MGQRAKNSVTDFIVRSLPGDRAALKRLQAVYKQFEDSLPEREFEKPLSRQEAFTLTVVCFLPEEFALEIEAFLG
jgi:hypothetical protein